MKKLVQAVLKHENLEPNQTPFRITDDDAKLPKGKRKMREWTSMFDKTIKTRLNPNAKKSKGRENFIYTEKAEDVEPAVHEQFRLYAEREPDITVEGAVRKFDQTGADGKLKFLSKEGIDTKKKLKDLEVEEDGAEMKRQFKARTGLAE